MNPAIGPLIKYGAPLLKEAISAIIPGKTGEKLADKLMPEFMRRAAELDGKIAGHQTDIIIGEQKSESWLTRNWRPLTMLVMVSIVALNHLIAPLCNTFFFPALAWLLNLVLSESAHVEVLRFDQVKVPPEVWKLIQVGIPGYIGARTVDKGFQMWRDTRQYQASHGVHPSKPAEVTVPPDAATVTRVPAQYSSITDLPIQGSD